MKNKECCLCHCGGLVTAHRIGEKGCFRISVPTPIEVGGTDDVIADGERISKYALVSQRGYYRHSCGHWSSWNESINSIRA